MYKIYIVEDDGTISSLLQDNLCRWGFEASCAQEFSAVSEEFDRVRPHLVLMDISLPFYNGYYWCGEIRKRSKVPIIFLSSRAENMDVVMAVNMGGDDYITKPFSMDVLIAKVNALLRRTYSYAEDVPVWSAGGALFNPSDNSLRVGARAVDLTKNEQRILQTLLKNKNRIVPREEIMRALWETEDFVGDNTLTVNINRLRNKLEDAGLPDFIITKKGQGYMVHD